MSQATATVAASRTPAETRALVIRSISYVLLAAVGLWILSKAVSRPNDFFTVPIVGLKFGALYALVALGYTMVYGIIELINFSHGDLFMLATRGERTRPW